MYFLTDAIMAKQLIRIQLLYFSSISKNGF